MNMQSGRQSPSVLLLVNSMVLVSLLSLLLPLALIDVLKLI